MQRNLFYALEKCMYKPVSGVFIRVAQWTGGGLARMCYNFSGLLEQGGGPFPKVSFLLDWCYPIATSISFEICQFCFHALLQTFSVDTSVTDQEFCVLSWASCLQLNEVVEGTQN